MYSIKINNKNNNIDTNKSAIELHNLKSLYFQIW